MTDRRRIGDTRSLRRDSGSKLTWDPNFNRQFRWLPRHGDPSCVAEWFSQKMIKSLAYLPIYTFIMVVLTFLVVVFGIPFVGGG